MTAIVEKNTGRLVKTISAPDDVIRLNTPEDCYATEDPPDKGMYHIGGEWQYLPPCPGEGYVFDYSSRQWVDTRSLDEVRNSAWNKIKAQRDELEFGGFEFEGHRYDSDIKAQGRITAAAQLGVPVEWTLQDNTTVWLEPDDQQRLVQALAMHITSVHARGKIAREKIYNATTIAEVEAVKL